VIASVRHAAVLGFFRRRKPPGSFSASSDWVATGSVATRRAATRRVAPDGVATGCVAGEAKAEFDAVVKVIVSASAAFAYTPEVMTLAAAIRLKN
jgi:hypothetical protein